MTPSQDFLNSFDQKAFEERLPDACLARLRPIMGSADPAPPPGGLLARLYPARDRSAGPPRPRLHPRPGACHGARRGLAQAGEGEGARHHLGKYNMRKRSGFLLLTFGSQLLDPISRESHNETNLLAGSRLFEMDTG